MADTKKHSRLSGFVFFIGGALVVAALFAVTRIYSLSEKNQALPVCPKIVETAFVVHYEKSEKIEESREKNKNRIPRAAVVDFTLDSSVKPTGRLTGSAIAVKLEQALDGQYCLLTRSQINKAIRELRLQNSDFGNAVTARRFGEFAGADYLITGNIIQLGRRITVACQLFETTTGKIIQTAEVSADDVDDFNFIIKNAAKVLLMSKDEKAKYVRNKFNYRKHVENGKKAFAVRDYARAAKSFKLALESGRNNEIEELLKLAVEKAADEKIINERKEKYLLAISRGEKFIKEGKWKEAEAAYRTAMKVPGYEFDVKAKRGIVDACDKGLESKKRLKAEKTLESLFAQAARYNAETEKLSDNKRKYLLFGTLLGQVVNFVNDKMYASLYPGSKKRLDLLYRSIQIKLNSIPCQILPDLKKNGMRKLSDLSALPNACIEQEKAMAKLFLPAEVETCQSGIVLCLIPPGEFKMGVEKRREVIKKAFYCGKFEITQSQWKKVMGSNPSYFKKSGPDAPVEQVSWNDSREFLKRLCLLEGVPLGTYRLPTEKEWEYACRAGSDSTFCYGDRLDSTMANFNGNYPHNASAGIFRAKTMPVGSFKANKWGLYDTHGNVWEWCWDSAGKNSQEKNIRGGSWNIGANECRSYSKAKYYPAFRFAVLGLRIIREIPEINSQNKQTVK